MSPHAQSSCIAFDGPRRIAIGPLAEVAAQTKQAIDGGAKGPVLIFDDITSELVEVDFRGTVTDVVARLPAAPSTSPPEALEPAQVPPADVPRGRGRPRLGVVAREVTLLPRHWDWLASQPGGASVALRKLVEVARRSHAAADVARKSRESAYRFMSAMASGYDTFEEASRALFARQGARFQELVRAWPVDVRQHALALALASFAAEAAPDPQE
ncbi:MAG: DUF2239 family protein [Rhizobacter sp.]|jgi:hypothetical protein